MGPFQDPAPSRPEPGPWFRSQFPGECSRGGETFPAQSSVRADGDGGWECWECVEEAPD